MTEYNMATHVLPEMGKNQDKKDNLKDFHKIKLQNKWQKKKKNQHIKLRPDVWEA